MKKKIVFSMLAGALLCSSLGSVGTVAGAAAANSDRAVNAQTEYQHLHPDEKFNLSDTDPEFAAMMQKYIYNDIYRQSVLAPRERYLVTLSVLTTAQNEKQLAVITEEALNAGVTPLELKEGIYHTAPYIGFAKTSEALEAVNEVFRQKNISLPLSPQGTTNDADRFEKGLAFQVGTYGERITKMREATPENQKHLQDDLSAFCFGDIYTRRVLDLKQREMITMAAIGTLGIEAQFRSHVNGTLAAGATEDEVIGVITAMNPYVGFPRTLWMLKIANECFAARH